MVDTYMRNRLALALALATAAAPAGSARGEGWSFVVSGGAALNASATLKVEQSGQPELSHRAQYETRPFKDPFYYALRVARAHGRGQWEVQLLHHKLYLKNTTSEITHFEITHGFNLITIARSFAGSVVNWRAGAGVVFAHTESTVRGEDEHGGGGMLGTGYELAGPAALVGAGGRLALSERLFVVPELQATAAWAKVSVAGGHAVTPNLALHFLLGVGYRF